MTDQQRSALLMWVTAGKSEQRLAKGAQVILCAAADVCLKDIETDAVIKQRPALSISLPTSPQSQPPLHQEL